MFVFGSYDNFSQCFTFSLSFVTMSSSAPSGVRRVDRWTRNCARRVQIVFTGSGNVVLTLPWSIRWNREDLELDPGLVAQQSQFSSCHRGCAALCG